jgi:hypothetical protein
MARFSLSVLLIAGVLALAVAPPAISSHVTEVHATAVTLGPGGSVSVSVTVDCTAGYEYFLASTVRQKSGKVFNTTGSGVSGTCSTDGPETVTLPLAFGQGPFRSGRVVVESFVSVCEPFAFDHCATDTEVVEIRATR